MLISDLNFRDVYHKVFVICNVDLSQLSDLFACDENANGVMVYGYVDYEAGLTFEVLSCVRISDDNSVYIYGGNEEVTFKFRNGSVKDKNVIFGGRLGQYKYFDMHAVIKSALEIVNKL